MYQETFLSVSKSCISITLIDRSKYKLVYSAKGTMCNAEWQFEVVAESKLLSDLSRLDHIYIYVVCTGLHYI